MSKQRFNQGGLTEFFQHFGPAFTSGLGTYANLASVIAQREFNQVLGTSNTLTALTSASDNLSKSIIDLDTKISEAGGSPNEALIAQKEAAQQNLAITRSRINSIITGSINNTGLNSGLGGSFLRQNPGLIPSSSTTGGQGTGFVQGIKNSYNETIGKSPAEKNYIAKEPVPDTAPTGTDTSTINQTDPQKLQKDLQGELFKDLGIEPIAIATQDQYTRLKNRSDLIKNFGNPGKKQQLAYEAISTINDSDFVKKVQQYQPGENDPHLGFFKLIESSKRLIDNSEALYNVAPNAVGTGIQSLSGVTSLFTENKESEVRKKLDENYKEFLAFARNLKSVAGAAVSPSEQLGIYAGFPNPAEEGKGFGQALKEYKIKLDSLYQTELNGAKQTPKDYGQYENPNYLQQPLSDKLNQEQIKYLNSLPSWDILKGNKKSQPEAPPANQPEQKSVVPPDAPPRKTGKELVMFEGQIFDNKEGVFKNPNFKPTADSPSEAPPGTYAEYPKETQKTTKDKNLKTYTAVDNFKQMIKTNPETFLKTIEGKQFNDATKRAIIQAVKELRAEGYQVGIY